MYSFEVSLSPWGLHLYGHGVTVYTYSLCGILRKKCIALLFYILDINSMGKKMMQELLGAFPGIDEAMSFAEVMKYLLTQILYFCVPLFQGIYPEKSVIIPLK